MSLIRGWLIGDFFQRVAQRRENKWIRIIKNEHGRQKYLGTTLKISSQQPPPHSVASYHPIREFRLFMNLVNRTLRPAGHLYEMNQPKEGHSKLHRFIISIWHPSLWFSVSYLANIWLSSTLANQVPWTSWVLINKNCQLRSLALCLIICMKWNIFLSYMHLFRLLSFSLFTRRGRLFSCPSRKCL